MSRFSCLLAPLLAVLFSAPIHAQSMAQEGCRLAIETSADNWMITYNPFVQDQVMQQFDWALVNLGDAPCSGVIRTDIRGQAFGLVNLNAVRTIPYLLVDETAGVDITPRAGRSRQMGGRNLVLAPGERRLARFSLAVGSTELLSSGLYTQTIYLSVEDGDGEVLAERPVAAGIDVTSAAIIGLRGEYSRTGGVASIDLGELTPGAQQLAAALFVMSTGSYSIDVISINAGFLRQEGGNWSVPYTLAIGEHAVDLRRGDRVNVTSRRPRIDSYPLEINIGDTAGRRAGEYSDVIMFTVAAL